MFDRLIALNASDLVMIALGIAFVYVAGVATRWHLARRVIAHAVTNLTATINDRMETLNGRLDQTERSVEERLTRIEARVKSKQ
jgi:hypothetical protein